MCDLSGGFSSPRLSAAAGWIWIAGRVVYALGESCKYVNMHWVSVVQMQLFVNLVLVFRILLRTEMVMVLNIIILLPWSVFGAAFIFWFYSVPFYNISVPCASVCIIIIIQGASLYFFIQGASLYACTDLNRRVQGDLILVFLTLIILTTDQHT